MNISFSPGIVPHEKNVWHFIWQCLGCSFVRFVDGGNNTNIIPYAHKLCPNCGRFNENHMLDMRRVAGKYTQTWHWLSFRYIGRWEIQGSTLVPEGSLSLSDK